MTGRDGVTKPGLADGVLQAVLGQGLGRVGRAESPGPNPVRDPANPNPTSGIPAAQSQAGIILEKGLAEHRCEQGSPSWSSTAGSSLTPIEVFLRTRSPRRRAVLLQDCGGI